MALYSSSHDAHDEEAVPPTKKRRRRHKAGTKARERSILRLVKSQLICQSLESAKAQPQSAIISQCRERISQLKKQQRDCLYRRARSEFKSHLSGPKIFRVFQEMSLNQGQLQGSTQVAQGLIHWHCKQNKKPLLNFIIGLFELFQTDHMNRIQIEAFAQQHSKFILPAMQDKALLKQSSNSSASNFSDNQTLFLWVDIAKAQIPCLQDIYIAYSLTEHYAKAFEADAWV